MAALGVGLTVIATPTDPALPRAALPQAFVDGAEEPCIVSPAAQHIPDPPTDDLGRLEPRELDEGRIDVGAEAVGIRDLDLFAHLVDRHGQERQLLPTPAPLGDVGGEQHTPAVRHAALANADPAAVDGLVLELDLAST